MVCAFQADNIVNKLCTKCKYKSEDSKHKPFEIGNWAIRISSHLTLILPKTFAIQWHSTIYILFYIDIEF